ncbi:MAG: hypothetical protein V3S33_08250, partial [Gammaproteobacteria bacterium]
MTVFKMKLKRGEEHPSLNLAPPGLLHDPVSLRQSGLRYPASLESPGSAFHGGPVRRDEGPLDLRL